MISYTSTEARKNFAEIIRTVQWKKKIIAIGKKGKSEKDVLIVPYPQLDSDDIPISQINQESESFSFLESEPDIYSLQDIKKRYV